MYDFYRIIPTYITLDQYFPHFPLCPVCISLISVMWPLYAMFVFSSKIDQIHDVFYFFFIVWFDICELWTKHGKKSKTKIELKSTSSYNAAATTTTATIYLHLWYMSASIRSVWLYRRNIKAWTPDYYSNVNDYL